MKRWLAGSLSLVLVCCVWLQACNRGEAKLVVMPNVQVVDNHGRPFSLASLRGKLVLIDFVHVGCPSVCTSLTSKFGEIADGLGAELGSKVVLVSMTNDPEHDGPQQLLELAKSSDADLSGWFFVTGKSSDVNRVIRAFGLNNDPLPDGSPNHITRVFLLGRDGHAIREYAGMTMNSQQIVSQIREALAQESAS